MAVQLWNIHIAWYMSKITQTQKLGVSRWRATSRATVCTQSCLGRLARGKGYQESSLLSIPSLQSPTYTLPCPMVASFGLRNQDIHNFFGLRNAWRRCIAFLGTFFCHRSSIFGYFFSKIVRRDVQIWNVGVIFYKRKAFRLGKHSHRITLMDVWRFLEVLMLCGRQRPIPCSVDSFEVARTSV